MVYILLWPMSQPQELGDARQYYTPSFSFIVIVTIIAAVIVTIWEVLGTELWVPGKHSTTELRPQPFLSSSHHAGSADELFKCSNCWRHFLTLHVCVLCRHTCAMALA